MGLTILFFKKIKAGSEKLIKNSYLNFKEITGLILHHYFSLVVNLLFGAK